LAARVPRWIVLPTRFHAWLRGGPSGAAARGALRVRVARRAYRASARRLGGRRLAAFAARLSVRRARLRA